MLGKYRRSLIYLLFLTFIVVFLFKNMFIPALLVLFTYYLLFGFVVIGMGYLFISTNQEKGFRIVNMSCPYTLLGTEKAYYFWIKASKLASVDKNYKKALFYVQKVKPKKLSTLSDQSLFYSMVASWYYLTGAQDEAQTYMRMAIDTPHKVALNRQYELLSAEINTSFVKQ